MNYPTSGGQLGHHGASKPGHESHTLGLKHLDFVAIRFDPVAAVLQRCFFL